MHVEYSRHIGKKYGRWHVVFVFEFEENYVLFYSIVTSSNFQGGVQKVFASKKNEYNTSGLKKFPHLDK